VAPNLVEKTPQNALGRDVHQKEDLEQVGKAIPANMFLLLNVLVELKQKHAS